ncbi:DMT family transporter [Methylobrevis pamukkalensis]|uniref:EamA-like transporter family protein n=1 Tax=Methylobrevis pamukkalensis TaxID=1439726 RepID=A0A1E3GZP8_9HYPH|nr:DMT family transporter [Methylobrevis pamukkalensis]ODN68801.1 EamA-like transporter family protein [Methylobrevis pamukkalensis]
MTVLAAADRHRNAIVLGVMLMLLGDFMFSLNDAIGKWLMGTYGVGQVLLLRSLAAMVVLVPLAWSAGAAGLFRLERPGLQVARAVLSTLEIVLFYAAVASLPLADVMTFYLAAPIWVAALSPFVLGEKVGWRRWSAIVIGFVGVVVALGPSSASLSLPALLSIAGSFAFAMMILLSRQLRATSDTALVFWQTIGALVAGLVIAPFDWIAPEGGDLMLMGLLGVVALAAHMLINRALKLAPAAVIAPIQYTLLIWALILGYLFFGDLPDMYTAIGAVIIVGAGLFIFERQKKTTGVPKEQVQDIA